MSIHTRYYRACNVKMISGMHIETVVDYILTDDIPLCIPHLRTGIEGTMRAGRALDSGINRLTIAAACVICRVAVLTIRCESM